MRVFLSVAEPEPKDSASAVFYGNQINSGSVFYGQSLATAAVFYGTHRVLQDGDAPQSGTIEVISRAPNSSIAQQSQPYAGFTTQQQMQTAINTPVTLLLIPGVTQVNYDALLHNRQPLHGTVRTLDTAQGIAIEYTPDSGYRGWDIVGYTLYRAGQIVSTGSWLIAVGDTADTAISLNSIPNQHLPYNSSRVLDLSQYIVNPTNRAVDIVVSPVGGLVESYDATTTTINMRSYSTATTETITVRVVDDADNGVVYAERVFQISTDPSATTSFNDLPVQTLVLGQPPLNIDLSQFLIVGNDTPRWAVKSPVNVIPTLNNQTLSLVPQPDAPTGDEQASFLLCLLDQNGTVLKQQTVQINIRDANSATVFRVRALANGRRVYERYWVVAQGQKIDEQIDEVISLPRVDGVDNAELTFVIERESGGRVDKSTFVGTLDITETVPTQ